MLIDPAKLEREYLERALAHLKAGSYVEGERDMMWGEMEPTSRAAQMVANLRFVHGTQTATVAELRARLAKILSQDA